MIASVRGESFERCSHHEAVVCSDVVPAHGETWGSVAITALCDVADALGYESGSAYNEAYQARPSQVRRRLKALRAGRK